MAIAEECAIEAESQELLISPWSRGLYESRSGRMFHRRRLGLPGRLPQAARAPRVGSGCHDMLFYQRLNRQYDLVRVGTDVQIRRMGTMPELRAGRRGKCRNRARPRSCHSDGHFDQV